LRCAAELPLYFFIRNEIEERLYFVEIKNTLLKLEILADGSSSVLKMVLMRRLGTVSRKNCDDYDPSEHIFSSLGTLTEVVLKKYQ